MHPTLTRPPYPLNATAGVIDALRGLAAFWVFLFHCKPYEQSFPELHCIFDYGYLGVPIFFVVSGYCIVGAALRLPKASASTAHFLGRRFWRIYPTYWASVAMIVASPLALALYNRIVQGRFSYHPKDWMRWSWLDWLKILTLTEIFDPNDVIPTHMNRFATLNGVYWSLGIEVQFYLVVAVLIFWRVAVVPGVLLLSLASLATSALPGVASSGLFIVYFPMFAVGVIPLSKTVNRSCWLYLVGTQLCLAVVLNYLIVNNYQSGLEPMMACLTAALLLAIRDSVTAELVASAIIRSRCGSVLRGLGRVSYSLYLVHAPVWTWSEACMPDLHPFARTTISILVVSLAVAAFFRMCEAPFLNRQPSLDLAKTHQAND